MIELVDHLGAAEFRDDEVVAEEGVSEGFLWVC